MSLNEGLLVQLLERVEPDQLEARRAEVARVLTDMEFYEHHLRPLVRIGEGCADARPDSLARHLLRYAKQHGVANAIIALKEFLGVNAVRTTTYVYVENVTTDREIDLGNNVVAMPESAGPFAYFATTIAEIKGVLKTTRGTILAAAQEESPFLVARKREGVTPFDGLQLRAPGLDRIDTALKMLTLCGPAFPAIRARTTMIATEAFRLLRSAGEAIAYDYPGYSLVGMPKIITDEPRELTPLYNALTESDRRRVDMALDRLGLSIAKEKASDAMVDLAIALEALLSDDGNKEELTYRLRLRAALFLADSLNERQLTKKLVNKIYSERSSVVHGEIPKRASPELRSKAEELVGKLIRKILTIGFVPDWHVVELTGGCSCRGE